MHAIIELTPEQQKQVDALLIQTESGGAVIAQCFKDGIKCKVISPDVAENVCKATGRKYILVNSVKE